MRFRCWEDLQAAGLLMRVGVSATGSGVQRRVRPGVSATEGTLAHSRFACYTVSKTAGGIRAHP